MWGMILVEKVEPVSALLLLNELTEKQPYWAASRQFGRSQEA
jgi:hypothetical protein